MTYVSGEPIESIVTPQAERDRVMSALVELMFMELFELRMVQTDPTFANYQVSRRQRPDRIAGFWRHPSLQGELCQQLPQIAGRRDDGERDRLVAAAERIGYAMGDEDSEYRALVLELFLLALEPLRHEGFMTSPAPTWRGVCRCWPRRSPTTGFLARASHRRHVFSPQAGWHVPAGEPGKARVDVNQLVSRWLR